MEVKPRSDGPVETRAGGARGPAWWPAIAAGLAAAVAVHVFLAPASGVDTDPPVCASYLGYTVPCGNGAWIAVALAAAVAAAVAVRAVQRRRWAG